MKKAIAIALVVLGLGLAGVFITFDWSSIDTFGTKPISTARTLSAANAEKVQIEVSSMDVKIVRGFSDDIQVRLEGRASEKFENDFQLLAEEQNGTALIKGEYKSRFTIGFNVVMVDMIVELPEKLWKEVEVRSSSGGIELDQLHTDKLQMAASSGDLEVSRLKAREARLDTESGDIELGEAEMDTLDLTLGSGTIDIERYQVKQLNFDANSGDVELKDGSGSVKGKTGSGSIKMEAGRLDGDVVLHAGSGSVKLEIEDRQISADVRLTTRSGSRAVNWDAFNTESDGKDELAGQVGSGQYQVAIETGSGSIKLSHS